MPTCLFCQTTEARTSKEHWIPRAWGEYFPRLPGLVRSDKAFDGQSSVRLDNISPFDLQFSGVCEKCNSEWLREIDVAAENVALRLGLTNSTVVHAHEVPLLARSLYRAALIGMWGKRTSHGSETGRMAEFYLKRLPPDDVQILIAKSDEPFLYAGGHYSAVMADEDLGIVARTFGFGTIGCLYVVVIVGMPGISRTVRRVGNIAVLRSERTLVRLWPRERGRLELPSQRITRRLAANSAELGVLLNQREPSLGPDPTFDSEPRFLPGGSAWGAMRPPTKLFEPGADELEPWVSWAQSVGALATPTR